MSLDPIRTTQVIANSYRDYLLTTFRLKNNDLQEQMEAALTTKFVNGPVLEATPPFQNGVSIEGLVQEGVLSSRFRSLQSDALPVERALYLHQDQAIRKATIRRRNLVVATGTGSGKTESFLVPILNHLFREEERGELEPGVRALLLYPMNALANDQLARMRALLAKHPSISFGRYTGETREGDQEANELYRRMYSCEPYANELISRRQMRETPPHILLTNYAMLEYLLLRPDDHAFFDGEHARHWRFLVIDEAHTYNGAKGIEMAMLLRRLKDRVVDGQPGRLQCIITSATLARNEEGFPEVVHFARQLVGEHFEWDLDDTNRQDIIKATRTPLDELHSSQWMVEPRLYPIWRDIVSQSIGQNGIARLVEEGCNCGIPQSTLTAAVLAAGDDCPRFLYEVLGADPRVSQLRRALSPDPRFLDDVATEVFGNAPDARDNLVALVDLAAKAKPADDHLALIPARYHLFVRAMEGAYLTLRPSCQLYLERQEQVDCDGREFRAFELAVCRQCGATYLVGERQNETNGEILGLPGKKSFENPSGLEFYLVLDDDADQVPDNEDEAVAYGNSGETEEGDRYTLCAACGAIDSSKRRSPLCECGQSNYVDVIRVKTRNGQVHKCPACGRQSSSGLVWRFLTGKDATASVLATALYQQIPPRDVAETKPGTSGKVVYDEWGPSIASEQHTGSDSRISAQGRNLLAFSDSRQDAAFFAPYLDRTYSQMLRRRLILQTINDHRDDVLSMRWRVQDLIGALASVGRDLNLFAGMSAQEQNGEVWKWVLYELLRIDRRNGLEGLGYLGFSLVKPERWQPSGGLLKWGLSEDEVWLLAQILLDSFRLIGAVLFPDCVSPTDDFFYPRNREYFFRGESSARQQGLLSWSPSGPHATNSRLDFLQRLAQVGLGLELVAEDCANALRRLWTSWLSLHGRESCWNDLISAADLDRQGVVYRLKPNVWELRAATVDPSVRWYFCDTCHELTLFNLRGVCPTYRCHGLLRSCDPAAQFRNNHYRKLYSGMKPIKLVAREHTAQLSGTAAARLQEQFVQGEVNVLSCSTTFELGVDVGQLESVFMRNVPPTAANYVQRAGRAGRRTDSAAFALTFAQRRSHDLTHFYDPMRMVKGEINAPRFEIANEKIVRRHVYAAALAAFWKLCPDKFGNVESFFFGEGSNGPTMFEAYLSARPDDLYTTLKRIVPEALHKHLQIETWGWTKGLFDPQEGVLALATAEVTSDVQVLQEARLRLVQQSKPADYLSRRINTIRKRALINHLSSRNVIPKYGFPVDVVELEIWHHSGEARDLELDRDLRIGLSEYAPSSQIVANGRLWTSRYLKKVPNREWPRYEYAVCDYCNRYHRVIADTGHHLANCDNCGRPLDGRIKGEFVIPEFGFITSLDPPGRPGEAQPERTYTTRTYYSGDANEGERISMQLGQVSLSVRPAHDATLAVINHAGRRGFKVCPTCGYAILSGESVPSPHKSPWQTECNSSLRWLALGHEFKTDILQLQIEGYSNPKPGFWLSLLYALLDGASESNGIDRRDLDGCLYACAGDVSTQSLVLFDDVPGGAGHVQRIASDEGTIIDVLRTALRRLEMCECGGADGHTSCYGCLRNYRNQFCHDELDRGSVIEFIRGLGI